MGTIDDSLYLKNQVLTYIGNKRRLLNVIEEAIAFVSTALNKEKLITLDLFSGSGIVARLLKNIAKPSSLTTLKTIHTLSINVIFLIRMN